MSVFQPHHPPLSELLQEGGGGAADEHVHGLLQGGERLLGLGRLGRVVLGLCDLCVSTHIYIYIYI